MSSYELSFTSTPVIINGGTGVSNEILCLAAPAVLFVPAGFAQCNITFQAASASGGTYGTLVDSTGSPVTVTNASASTAISLEPALFNGIQFLKVVCATPQAITLTMMFTPIFGNYFS